MTDVRPILIWLAIAVLAAGPVVLGVRILRQPGQIRAEQYQPTTPTTGPYTADELKRAEDRIIAMSPKKLLQGATTQEVLGMAQANRQMERLRRESWTELREQRAHQACQRRYVGWLLICIGILLMALWTLAALRLQSLRQNPSPLL